MTEDAFWKLIETVSLRDLVNDLGATADLESLRAALGLLPAEQLVSFFHQFSSKLHALDTPAHYAACRVSGKKTSSDVFLYARCHVLCLGRAFYEDILANPSKFPSNLWCENILYFANEIYDEVYESDALADQCLSYESFTNPLWSSK